MKPPKTPTPNLSMYMYMKLLFMVSYIYTYSVLPRYLEGWSDSNLHLVLFYPVVLSQYLYMYYMRDSLIHLSGS